MQDVHQHTHLMCTGSPAVTCPTSAHLRAICRPSTRSFSSRGSTILSFSALQLFAVELSDLHTAHNGQHTTRHVSTTHHCSQHTFCAAVTVPREK
jgi:hypothetical protein